jgi:hypothetical protein
MRYVQHTKINRIAMQFLTHDDPKENYGVKQILNHFEEEYDVNPDAV